jgi:hypothetical protein
MRPCEPTGDVSFHLTPTSEDLFPDLHELRELSNRPVVIFRGVGADALIRTDNGAPRSLFAPHGRARRGKQEGSPPADGD